MGSNLLRQPRHYPVDTSEGPMGGRGCTRNATNIGREKAEGTEWKPRRKATGQQMELYLNRIQTKNQAGPPPHRRWPRWVEKVLDTDGI